MRGLQYVVKIPLHTLPTFSQSWTRHKPHLIKHRTSKLSASQNYSRLIGKYYELSEAVACYAMVRYGASASVRHVHNFSLQRNSLEVPPSFQFQMKQLYDSITELAALLNRNSLHIEYHKAHLSASYRREMALCE